MTTNERGGPRPLFLSIWAAKTRPSVRFSTTSASDDTDLLGLIALSLYVRSPFSKSLTSVPVRHLIPQQTEGSEGRNDIVGRQYASFERSKSSGKFAALFHLCGLDKRPPSGKRSLGARGAVSPRQQQSTQKHEPVRRIRRAHEASRSRQRRKSQSEFVIVSARRRSRKRRPGGVSITLEVWPHMIQAWPLWNAELSTRDDAR
jgi:hypothetical protein